MHIEYNSYYNKKNNWILSEIRVYSDARQIDMLNASLQIVDLDTKRMVYDIDDVWEYDWVKLND